MVVLQRVSGADNQHPGTVARLVGAQGDEVGGEVEIEEGGEHGSGLPALVPKAVHPLLFASNIIFANLKQCGAKFRKASWIAMWLAGFQKSTRLLRCCWPGGVPRKTSGINGFGALPAQNGMVQIQSVYRRFCNLVFRHCWLDCTIGFKDKPCLAGGV